MGYVLSPDQHRQFDRKVAKLLDQLGQREYPFNPALALEALQGVIEGKFMKPSGDKLDGISHVIDCDTDPFLPSGWQVEEHKKGGQFLFDPTKVRLFLSPKQKNGKTIPGHDLRKELANQPVLNACVLDYLLAHPELIPESWKGKYIYFWGTIYRRADGDLYVRFLYWDDGRWDWNYFWLGYGWSGHGPAAVASV